ncbi:MAG: ATP-dependent zinc metalloprotease FtsH, partial [Pseudomonadota bacterium]|nr:ATP-dependent zinc metalloprotease FtsH [Pseudomonadota bacterium]
MSDIIKNLVIWTVIAVVIMSLFSGISGRNNAADEYNYSEFMQQVQTGQVEEVTISGIEIAGTLKSGQSFITYSPETDNSALVGELLNSKVKISGQAPEKQSFLAQIFIHWFPFLLLIGVWIFFMRQMQGGAGGGRGAMSFGKSKAKLMNEDQVKVTFKDVAGVEEAKEEVKELVDFLKDPGKFQNLGGQIPRGVLMNGSPGTGKTLLARAIAGEAKVPFFTISGSDFVEMFVGVGASRVRDMFEQAKKHAPCIIFIDEIDAVGRHRGAGVGGGHDEREQTLNQLLVEMDGFEGNEGVIVIAATNRPDVLDPALLRPGRFDRQVTVPLPDIRGREQILKVHMKKTPIANDVKPKLLARGTPGFSGADLANLVNEAALFAARASKKIVDMSDFEKAKDKILMGGERKSMVMNDDERKLTAYHEAGHAIVGRLVPDHDPVYKVSIIPRGRALGVTMFLPEEDRYSNSRQRINSMIAALFGGRVAEEEIFGEDAVTTGASNDIERATALARSMVTKWGLSDKMGPLAYAEEENEVFLGKSSAQQQKSVSNETARTIDSEIRKIIDTQYSRATKLIKDNMDKMHLMADALMKYETIDTSQIDEI